MEYLRTHLLYKGVKTYLTKKIMGLFERVDEGVMNMNKGRKKRKKCVRPKISLYSWFKEY
jgi:hypothetical protein